MGPARGGDSFKGRDFTADGSDLKRRGEKEEERQNNGDEQARETKQRGERKER